MKLNHSNLSKILENDESFATKLVDVYISASKTSLLPSLADCQDELRRLALGDDRLKHNADNQDFLVELHLCARQLNAKNLIRDRVKERAEARYQHELAKLEVSIERHKALLYSKLTRAVRRDDYGVVISDNRSSVILDFFQSQKIAQDPESYQEGDVIGRLMRYCEDAIAEYELQLNCDPVKGLEVLTKSGQSFEVWVESSLSRLGWSVRGTRATGDQGVDLIAEKNLLRVAIQCKAYSGSVGNKAVQEVVAGMRHYDLDRAAVVSTGTYTQSAISLAKSNGVLMLTPQDLPVLYDLLVVRK